MEYKRYEALERYLLGAGTLPPIEYALASDLFENGVTSLEWHGYAMHTDSQGHKIHPIFRRVSEPLRLGIYNYLVDLEKGRLQPTPCRIRNADENYPF